MFITLAVTALWFAACTTPSPETGYHVGWGVIEGGESPFSLKMDNGSLLVILSTLAPNLKLDSGKRVIVNYTVIEPVTNAATPTYNVRVNMLYKVFSEPLLAQSDIGDDEGKISEDTLGYDPIRVNWANFSGEFLNLGVQIWTGNVNAKVNLVYDDTENDAAIRGDTAFLTLRHNALGSLAARPTNEQYASFPLSGLVVPPNTERPVKLIWTDDTKKSFSRTGIFRLNATAVADPVTLGE